MQWEPLESFRQRNAIVKGYCGVYNSAHGESVSKAVRNQGLANITREGTKTESIPFRSWKEQRVPFFPPLFNIVPQILAKWQEEVTGIQTGRVSD